MSGIEELKLICREDDIPFFTDTQLQYYLEQASGEVDRAAYTCLCIKAENTQLQVSGLSTADTSQYFRRLASQYRPSNSGIL